MWPRAGGSNADPPWRKAHNRRLDHLHHHLNGPQRSCRFARPAAGGTAALGHFQGPDGIGPNKLSVHEERFPEGGTDQIGTQLDNLNHVGVGPHFHNGNVGPDIASRPWPRRFPVPSAASSPLGIRIGESIRTDDLATDGVHDFVYMYSPIVAEGSAAGATQPVALAAH